MTIGNLFPIKSQATLHPWLFCCSKHLAWPLWVRKCGRVRAIRCKGGRQWSDSVKPTCNSHGISWTSLDNWSLISFSKLMVLHNYSCCEHLPGVPTWSRSQLPKWGSTDFDSSGHQRLWSLQLPSHMWPALAVCPWGNRWWAKCWSVQIISNQHLCGMSRLHATHFFWQMTWTAGKHGRTNPNKTEETTGLAGFMMIGSLDLIELIISNQNPMIIEMWTKVQYLISSTMKWYEHSKDQKRQIVAARPVHRSQLANVGWTWRWSPAVSCLVLRHLARPCHGQWEASVRFSEQLDDVRFLLCKKE